MTRKKLGGAGGGAPTVVNDNLFSKDLVEFTLGVCEGPIAGLYNGPKTFYLDDTPMVSATGDNNFDTFELSVYHGDPIATPVRNTLGGLTSTTSIGVVLATNVPIVRVSPTALQNQMDVIEVRVLFNALYNATSGGDVLNWRAEYNVTIVRLSDSAVITDQDFTIVGKTSSGYLKEHRFGVPKAASDYEVTFTLLPETGGTANTVRNLTLESIQWVTNVDRSYDSLAVVRGLGVATNKFSSTPQFTGVYSGLLVMIPDNYNPVTRHYTGTWGGAFQVGHTDNPAWCLYDILMNEKHGFKAYYPDLLVDRYSFYEAAQWCDELIVHPEGGYQPRWTYNDLIQEGRSGLELISYIAGTFGAIVTSDLNGTLRIIVDKPGSMAMVFGPESITEEGFTYQFSDITQRFNDITVSFVNPDLDWENDVRRVFVQDYIDDNGRITDEMVAVGCIDPYEAQRRAYRKIIQGNTELATVSFKTARQGVVLDIFDLIGISDPYMNWGLSGRVKSVVGSTITLRDPLFLPTATNITMEVQTPSGIHTLTVQSATGTTTTLTITGGSWPADAPDKAQFALSQEAIGLTKPFRIISIDEDDQSPEIITITALEHNVNKYGDVDGLMSSGTILYDYEQARFPVAPSNLQAFSGTEHLYINGAGQVVSRIYLTWEQESRYLNDEFVVYYRRKDTEASFAQFTTNKFDAYIDNVQDAKIYEIYVEAVNAAKRHSKPSTVVEHTVIGKTALPGDVTNLEVTPMGADLRLTWTGVSDLDLSHYEIRVGSTWASSQLEGTTQDTSYYDRNIQGSSITYLVKAVDTTGNKSDVAASVTHAVGVPTTPTAVLAFKGAEYQITITPNPGDTLPVSEFVIRYGAEVVFRGKSSVFKSLADWVGSRDFDITVINSAGIESLPRQVTGVINAPTAPSPTSQVIDNNILLRWSNGTATLPIVRTEIRKGPVFASAQVLQSIDGTFANYFESQGGTYYYWLVHVDSAGNYGTQVGVNIIVDDPPNFVLFADFNADLSAGTLTNAVYNDGKVIFGVDNTELYQEHFTDNSWNQPQNQIDAGFPIYIQPMEHLLLSQYQQEFDIGTVIGSCVVSVTPSMDFVAGDPSYQVNIEVKELIGDPWTLYTNTDKIYVTNVQYLRITIIANDDSSDDILQMNSLYVSTGLKLQDDAGSGTAAAGDPTGTTVTFNKSFIDIVSITVTPLSTTARLAVYDFDDVPDPTAFSVYLFDSSGNRVSGDFSWTARGY